LLRALIQLANARLKQKMGKDNASARLLDEADQLLADVTGPNSDKPPPIMGVDVPRLRQSLAGPEEKPY